MGDIQQKQAENIACEGCGSTMKYLPGTSQLLCDYCGSSKEISTDATTIREMEYNSYIGEQEDLDSTTTKVCTCSCCGASLIVEEIVKSFVCPYCENSLVDSDLREERLIKPSYILPFSLSNDEAQKIISDWIKKKWFITKKIKNKILDNSKSVKGVYIPIWTFDVLAITQYVGYTTVRYNPILAVFIYMFTRIKSYTVRVEKTLAHFFDDIQIPATQSFPEKYRYKLRGWKIRDVVDMNNNYLRGLYTEKYSVQLKTGYEKAQAIVDCRMRVKIKENMGGSNPKIESTDTTYNNITFKLVLVPLYIYSQEFGKSLYTIYINGCSGRIAGTYPKSKLKITILILTCLMLIFSIIYWVSG